MWSTASETGITFVAERRDSWKYACIHGLAIYKHDWAGLEIKKNVWSQICDQLRKFGRNVENVSREINWGHLIKK